MSTWHPHKDLPHEIIKLVNRYIIELNRVNLISILHTFIIYFSFTINCLYIHLNIKLTKQDIKKIRDYLDLHRNIKKYSYDIKIL